MTQWRHGSRKIVIANTSPPGTTAHDVDMGCIIPLRARLKGIVMPITTEQRLRQQRDDADREYQQSLDARARSSLSRSVATTTSPGPISPVSQGTLTTNTWKNVDEYLDAIAPGSSGRVIRFDKLGRFVFVDDGTDVTDSEWIALPDIVVGGWIRFGEKGEQPKRIMGNLSNGFAPPPREELGDNDPAQWDIGLSGRPEDPWKTQLNLALQRQDGERAMFSTMSKGGINEIVRLMRSYQRQRQNGANTYPIVRLQKGGFQHRDERIGEILKPMLTVIGNVGRDNETAPPVIDDKMNDEVGF